MDVNMGLDCAEVGRHRYTFLIFTGFKEEEDRKQKRAKGLKCSSWEYCFYGEKLAYISYVFIFTT